MHDQLTVAQEMNGAHARMAKRLSSRLTRAMLDADIALALERWDLLQGAAERLDTLATEVRARAQELVGNE